MLHAQGEEQTPITHQKLNAQNGLHTSSPAHQTCANPPDYFSRHIDPDYQKSHTVNTSPQEQHTHKRVILDTT